VLLDRLERSAADLRQFITRAYEEGPDKENPPSPQAARKAPPAAVLAIDAEDRADLESDFAKVLREHSTTVAARVAADRAAACGAGLEAQAAAASGAVMGIGAAAVHEMMHPNRLLKEAHLLNQQVKDSLDPIVRRAEAAIRRAEVSSFVQGMPLLSHLSKAMGTAVVENCDVLTDMVLDDILDETVALLNAMEADEKAVTGIQSAADTVNHFESLCADIAKRVDGGYTAEVLPPSHYASQSQPPRTTDLANSGAAPPTAPQPRTVSFDGTQNVQPAAAGAAGVAVSRLPHDVVRRVETYKRRYQQYSQAVDSALELQGVERHEIVCSIAEDLIEDLIAGASEELTGMLDSFSDALAKGELKL